MDIREALRSIWRRKYLVALIVALGASAAIGFSTRTTPVYAASAKVFIGTRAMEDPNDDLTSALQELTFSSEFLASYAEVLKSRPLAERVIADTNVTASPQDLTRRIDTRILPRTRI
ncbi:MAG TPA: Wzz/FepE/Etk N-terminal domain-containing protein, partial [Actinomycetota bacterium]|nr:Wzz/FepE/Etk N-terminal domain-containing protein [Actinomycetota bacterium]